MNDQKIRFVLSGDIHSPNEFDLYWNDAIIKLKDLEVKEIYYLDNSDWLSQTL